MIRYLTLFIYFLRFSFSKAMEFRIDFFFRIVMDSMFYIIQFLFFNIIYLHTDLIGGLTKPQMIIFISSYLFIDALNMSLFSNNMWYLPIYINKGELDYYLVRPVSTLFFVSFREFAANSFVNLLIAIGIVVWAFNIYPEPFDLWQIITYVLLLLNGMLIYYILHLFTILPSFWTHSPRGSADLFFSLVHSMERPDRIFTGKIRILFLYILPFALIVSFPTKVLFEPENAKFIASQALLTGLIFSFILSRVWKFALSNYNSASS